MLRLRLIYNDLKKGDFMNRTLIKQLMLYAMPILAYFVLTLAQPPAETPAEENPSINIIEYPDAGPNAKAESGYIGAYYTLQKLGINVGKDKQEFFLASKNAIKKSRLLDAAQTQVTTDLDSFVAKKVIPKTSPIPGISSQDLKEIIASVFPDIAKSAAQEFIRVNFDDKTGQLGDRTLTITGAQIFADIAKFLSLKQERYQSKYKINWSMLEPDIKKDNYQILKDFTGLRDVSELQIIKSEVLATLHKTYPQEEGAMPEAEATGNWLHPEELASIILANTKDVEKVIILPDLGLLLAPGQESASRTREIKQTLANIKAKLANMDSDTQTFIIDKAFVAGKPNTLQAWVPVIVNKQNNQLRIATIDPENVMKKEDPYLQLLLKYLS